MVPSSRTQQREQTRARIADHAATLFSVHGFDRTSIREVARSSGVDPALVLHYFGSKRALFVEVMGEVAAVEDRADDPTDFVLDGLVAKLDDQAAGTLARLRSMLTNADAGDHARAELGAIAGVLSGKLTGPNRAARAQLLLATSLGVAVARELLQVEELTALSAEEIAAELRPAIEALVG
ncbi:MAG TPA: TetR family transcriptional regulator [Microlunatus sp.]